MKYRCVNAGLMIPFGDVGGIVTEGKVYEGVASPSHWIGEGVFTFTDDKGNESGLHLDRFERVPG